MTLEFGQVVEERRFLGGCLFLRLLYDAGAATDLAGYLLGGLPVVEAVPFALEPDTVVGEGYAFVAAKAGVYGPELLGFKGIYLRLTVHEELQGRGLDAADGKNVAGVAEADGVGAGRVHADDPVRLAAAAGGVF